MEKEQTSLKLIKMCQLFFVYLENLNSFSYEKIMFSIIALHLSGIYYPK